MQAAERRLASAYRGGWISTRTRLLRVISRAGGGVVRRLAVTLCQVQPTAYGEGALGSALSASPKTANVLNRSRCSNLRALSAPYFDGRGLLVSTILRAEIYLAETRVAGFLLVRISNGSTH